MIPTPTEFPDSVFEGLDHTGPLPLYHQIATRIEKVITDGAMPVESWIENEVTLATRLKTSRMTTRRALEELVHRGLIARRQGRGTQVISGSAIVASTVTGLYDDLLAANRHPSTTVLTSEFLLPGAVVPPELHDRSSGEQLAHLRRVRSADGIPVALLTNWLPGLSSIPDDRLLESHGLFETLRFRGVTFRAVRQTIAARRGSPEECDRLELPKDSLVLTMRRRVSDPQGRIIGIGNHCYRPEAHAFEMTLGGG